MKKERIFILILIVLLILLSGFFLYLLKKSKTELLYAQRDALLQKQFTKDINVRLKDQTSKLYQKVDAFNVVDKNGRSIAINDLINKNMLCFYFDEKMCNSCITYQFDKIREFEQKYGPEKLLVFVTFDKMQLPYLNTIYQTEVSFFYIEETNLLVSENNFPSVFIINENLEVYSYYSIESSFSDYNEIYFNKITGFLEN